MKFLIIPFCLAMFAVSGAIVVLTEQDVNALLALYSTAKNNLTTYGQFLNQSITNNDTKKFVRLNERRGARFSNVMSETTGLPTNFATNIVQKHQASIDMLTVLELDGFHVDHTGGYFAYNFIGTFFRLFAWCVTNYRYSPNWLPQTIRAPRIPTGAGNSSASSLFTSTNASYYSAYNAIESRIQTFQVNSNFTLAVENYIENIGSRVSTSYPSSGLNETTQNIGAFMKKAISLLNGTRTISDCTFFGISFAIDQQYEEAKQLHQTFGQQQQPTTTPTPATTTTARATTTTTARARA